LEKQLDAERKERERLEREFEKIKLVLLSKQGE